MTCPSKVISPGPTRSGAERLLESAGLPSSDLAEIPLELAVRATSDAGRPIVVSDPAHPVAEAYRQLAMTVRDKLTTRAGGTARPFPRIVYA